MAKYDVTKVSRKTLEEVCRILLNSIGDNAHVTFNVTDTGDPCVRELVKEAVVNPRTRAQVDADIAKCLRTVYTEYGVLPSSAYVTYKSPLANNCNATLAQDLKALLEEETQD